MHMTAVGETTKSWCRCHNPSYVPCKHDASGAHDPLQPQASIWREERKRSSRSFARAALLLRQSTCACAPGTIQARACPQPHTWKERVAKAEKVGRVRHRTRESGYPRARQVASGSHASHVGSARGSPTMLKLFQDTRRMTLPLRLPAAHALG